MPGKTNRKHGRNKADCETYKKTGRQDFNKELKLVRHRKEHPTDVKSSSPVNYTRKKPLDVYEKIFSKNT